MSELQRIIEITLVAFAGLFMLGFIQKGIIAGLAYIIAGFIALAISTILTLIVDITIGTINEGYNA